uniref:Uncharacterized protein n=1 Tax=uncultured marine group II/III euryarchaeote KM3_13_C08 TaxID=1457871 RepID=A0A075GBW9_9EURY|nr:hypothetical protein [uncultured marine group II/III euryarchaeote KM3_13_C08]
MPKKPLYFCEVSRALKPANRKDILQFISSKPLERSLILALSSTLWQASQNFSPKSVNQIKPKVPLFFVSTLPELSARRFTNGCLLRGWARSVTECTNLTPKGMHKTSPLTLIIPH